MTAWLHVLKSNQMHVRTFYNLGISGKSIQAQHHYLNRSSPVDVLPVNARAIPGLSCRERRAHKNIERLEITAHDVSTIALKEQCMTTVNLYYIERVDDQMTDTPALALVHDQNGSSEKSSS